jgi:hypothetical protein
LIIKIKIIFTIRVSPQRLENQLISYQFLKERCFLRPKMTQVLRVSTEKTSITIITAETFFNNESRLANVGAIHNSDNNF